MVCWRASAFGPLARLFPDTWLRLCYKHICTKVTEKVAKVHSKAIAGQLWALLDEMTLLSTSEADWVVFETMVRRVFALLTPADFNVSIAVKTHPLLDVTALIAALKGG